MRPDCGSCPPAQSQNSGQSRCWGLVGSLGPGRQLIHAQNFRVGAVSRCADLAPKLDFVRPKDDGRVISGPSNRCKCIRRRCGSHSIRIMASRVFQLARQRGPARISGAKENIKALCALDRRSGIPVRSSGDASGWNRLFQSTTGAPNGVKAGVKHAISCAGP